MSGPCLCGDPECPSCGTAMGLWSPEPCPFCGCHACECTGCADCNAALVDWADIELGLCKDCALDHASPQARTIED